MEKAMYSLRARDFAKGILVAIGAAVFASLAAWLNTPGFEFGAFDWGELLRVALSAVVAYLAKNYFSDSQGRFLGRIG